MTNIKERLQKAIQNEETLILTEEELHEVVEDSTKEIKSINDLVLVHQTNYLPKEYIITPKDSNEVNYVTCSFTIKGEEKQFQYPVKRFRNTIHFCLNASVMGHEYGTWDKKYAVCLPLNTNKDKIVAGTECDLFSYGSVPIKNDGYILCPKEEIDKVKSCNPYALVVGYEGKIVTPYVNVFITDALGYKYKEPTNKSTSWNSSKDKENVKNIIKEENWEYTRHNPSKWLNEELRDQRIDMLINYLEMVINEDILMNESDNNYARVKEDIIYILEYSAIGLNYSFFGDMILNSPDTLPFKENNKKECFSPKLEILNKMLKEKFGIDIISLADGTTLFNHEYAINRSNKDVVADLIANTITAQIQRKSLEKKSKNNNLTFIEQLILKYNNQKEFYEVLKNIEQLKNIFNKKLNELTKEEKDMFIKTMNHIISLDSTNEYEFLIKHLEEVTKEEHDSYKEWIGFLKVRKEGLYLSINSYSGRDILNKITNINFKEILNKIKNTNSMEELYAVQKEYNNPSIEHIDEIIDNETKISNEQTHVSSIITDCLLDGDLTVKELYYRITKYIDLFKRYINGEQIIFNNKGEIINLDIESGLKMS